MIELRPPDLLERIFDQVNVAVMVVDSQHRVVYANEPAFQLFGIRSSANIAELEDLAGQCRYFDWSGNEIPVDKLPMLRVLAGEDIQPHNVKLRLPDGSFKWAHVTNYRFSIMGLTGALMVATDETREVELQRVAADVQRLEVLGTLAGGLAHNFNNILSIIDLSVITCLAGSDVGPDARAKLQQVLDASRHAGDVIKRMAQFSRTGKLEPKPTSMNNLLRDALTLIEPLVSRNINVVAKLRPDLPEVEIDPIEMQQVVFNLMLNARDAMPEGGQLAITTDLRFGTPEATGKDSKQWVTVTVSDTGLGMSDTVKRQIFLPFFTTKPGGTGLGLASALGIVRQHGGDIEVQSTVGKGSEFTISLPCSARESG